MKEKFLIYRELPEPKPSQDEAYARIEDLLLQKGLPPGVVYANQELREEISNAVLGYEATPTPEWDRQISEMCSRIKEGNFSIDPALVSVQFKIKRLENLAREISEGGIAESMFRYKARRFQKQAEGILNDLIGISPANLCNGYSRKKHLQMLATIKSVVTDVKFSSIWEEMADNFTTLEGWGDMVDCLTIYFEGAGEGFIKFIDPRTYIELVELVGIAAAKVYLREDLWDQLKTKIIDLGEGWTKADAKEKAKKLGKMMGSLVGVKVVATGVSAAKAAAKAEGGARLAAAKEAALDGIGTKSIFPEDSPMRLDPQLVRPVALDKFSVDQEGEK